MPIDNKFISKFSQVTSKAALAASYLVGKKDKIAADKAAVDSMRSELNKIDMNGQVVIGEGILDEAPLLYTGEFLGTKKGPNFDIAVDPVEGTNFVANNLPGGIAVLAIGEKGNLFNAPETYMDNIATGKIDKGLIDLDYPLEKNIKKMTAKLIEQGLNTTIPEFLEDSENRINKLWELCIYTPMDLETKNYILNQNDIFKRYEILLNYVETVLNS